METWNLKDLDAEKRNDCAEEEMRKKNKQHQILTVIYFLNGVAWGHRGESFSIWIGIQDNKSTYAKI